MMFQQNPCELACRTLATVDPVSGNGMGDSVEDHSGNAQNQGYGQSEKQQSAQTAAEGYQDASNCMETKYEIFHYLHHPFQENKKPEPGTAGSGTWLRLKGSGTQREYSKSFLPDSVCT